MMNYEKENLINDFTNVRSMSNASILIEERLNQSFLTSFPLEVVDDFEIFTPKEFVQPDILDHMNRLSLKK